MNRYRLSMYKETPSYLSQNERYYELEVETDQVDSVNLFGKVRYKKNWRYETLFRATSWDDATEKAKTYLDERRAREVKVVFEY